MSTMWCLAEEIRTTLILIPMAAEQEAAAGVAAKYEEEQVAAVEGLIEPMCMLPKTKVGGPRAAPP